MLDILVWLSLATPILLILYLLYRIGKRIWNWFHPENDSTETPPAPLKEMKVNREELKCPEFTSVEQEGWHSYGSTTVETYDEPTPTKPTKAGVRIWRVYRSVDQKNWAECDPALTERSACNYATYIKLNNPEEYVRVNDPEGLIVFYE